MAKRPVIMIPCYDIIEYQLLPCAFLLLMDKLGIGGMDPSCDQHRQQMQVFLGDWMHFSEQHRLEFLNRMARIMEDGASFEVSHVTVPNLAHAQLLKQLHTFPAHAEN